MLRWRALFLLALVALGRTSPLPRAQPPVQRDEDPGEYRLSDDVTPFHYEIKLIPHYNVENKIAGIESFSGTVNILADIKEDISDIVLHYDKEILTIEKVNVYEYIDPSATTETQATSDAAVTDDELNEQRNKREIGEFFDLDSHELVIPFADTDEETAEPTDETAEPTDETAEPTDATAEPTDETAEPTDETAEPTDETAEPTDATAEPTDETAEPTDETAEPTDETAEPTDETAEPTDATAEPTDTTAEPTDTTAEPTDTTAEPTDTTAEPTDTTAEPTDTTAEPTDTTAEPTDTTAEPTDTTAEPTDTTADPTATTTDPTTTTTDPRTELSKGTSESKDFEKLVIPLLNPTEEKMKIEIIISYSGHFEESISRMSGFYVSEYEDDENEEAAMLATQFEPTSARKAFPCFDEPRFKATFDLSIATAEGISAIANTLPVSETKTGDDVIQFSTTPKMSTYLLAFIVYETDSYIPVHDEDGTFSTYGRKEEIDAGKGELSQTDGPRMIKILEEYTDVYYYDDEDSNNMEMKKMTQAAIPDFSAGAMENWGLVTYRETALLFKEDGSAAAHKRVSEVIAHELAHQWFGNWVTTEWWDSIWLNEGFATYFEYYVTGDVYKEWRMNERFVLDEQMLAFDADSSTSSTPLTNKVETPTQISRHFSTISYSKGGSILRQIKNVLGDDEFQAAIKAYLLEQKYNTAVPADLFKHFKNENNETKTSLPDDQVEAVLENWTTQAGYPVITVTKDGDSAVLTQDRYLLSETEEEEPKKYDVYLSWVTDQDDTPTEPLPPQDWFRSTDEDKTINSTEGWQWIIVNPYQGGYYRVDYSESLWDQLSTALASHDTLTKISSLDRAALINNALNLARETTTRNMNYDKVFDMMTFLSHDTDFEPWAATRSSMAHVERLLSNSVAYKGFIQSIVKAAYDGVGFAVSESGDTSNVPITHRINVLTLACSAGYADCLTTAESQLSAYLPEVEEGEDGEDGEEGEEDSGEPVHDDLQSVVYCYGLKQDSGAVLWDRLWNKYVAARKDMNQRQLIASALGCVNDEEILKEYLSKSLEDEAIPKAERYLVFSAVYSNPDGGAKLALDFLLEKELDVLADAYGDRMVSLVGALAARLGDDADIDRLTELVNGKEGYEDVLTTLAANKEWVTLNEGTVTRALIRASDATAAALATSLALLCAALLALLR